MDLGVIFAAIVSVLAALAVIGALAFVVVWEWCAIRRTLTAHRYPPPDNTFNTFWRDRAALSIPERRP